MASGQGIYVTDSYWESLGETFSPTALLIKWRDQPDQKFLASDAIVDFATRESQQSGLAQSFYDSCGSIVSEKNLLRDRRGARGTDLG